MCVCKIERVLFSREQNLSKPAFCRISAGIYKSQFNCDSKIRSAALQHLFDSCDKCVTCVIVESCVITNKTGLPLQVGA